MTPVANQPGHCALFDFRMSVSELWKKWLNIFKVFSQPVSQYSTFLCPSIVPLSLSLSLLFLFVSSSGRLRTVNCSQRGLKIIPPNLPADLIVLDLSYNSLDIQQLREQVCQFKSLQLLSLSFTDLTTLSDILRQCSSVLELNLTGNLLESLNDTTFQGLNNLRRLLGLEVKSLASKQVFKELTSLRDLDLIFHGQSLPQGLFDNLIIQSLNLVLTQALALPAGVLSFGEKTLNTLQLIGEHVTQLDEDLLDGLSVLRKLFLVMPSVQQLPSRLFHSQQAGQAGRPANLQEVEINSVHSLPPMLFNQLASLETLQLKEIGSFPEEGFMASVINLRMLVITGSKLTTIPPRWFQELYSLSTLKLSGLQLESLHEDTLQGLISLNYLDLSYNNLKTLSSKMLAPVNKTLETLILTSNFLTNVSQQSLSGLHSLRFLDISENRLANIYGRSFAGMTYLSVLYLNNNRLTSLPRDLFRGLPQLEILSVSDNYLVEFPIAVLHLNTSLINLDLSANELRQVPAYQLCGFSYLETVNLMDNNLHCDCFLLAFQLCPQITVEGQCGTPLKYKDRDVKEIDLPESCLKTLANSLVPDRAPLPSSHPVAATGQSTVVRELFTEVNNSLTSRVRPTRPSSGPPGDAASLTSRVKPTRPSTGSAPDAAWGSVSPSNTTKLQEETPSSSDTMAMNVSMTTDDRISTSDQYVSSANTPQEDSLLQTNHSSEIQDQVDTSGVAETERRVMAGVRPLDVNKDAMEKPQTQPGVSDNENRPSAGSAGLVDQRNIDLVDAKTKLSDKKKARLGQVKDSMSKQPVASGKVASTSSTNSDMQETALGTELSNDINAKNSVPSKGDTITAGEESRVKEQLASAGKPGNDGLPSTALSTEDKSMTTGQSDSLEQKKTGSEQSLMKTTELTVLSDKEDGSLNDPQTSLQEMSSNFSLQAGPTQQREMEENTEEKAENASRAGEGQAAPTFQEEPDSTQKAMFENHASVVADMSGVAEYPELSSTLNMQAETGTAGPNHPAETTSSGISELVTQNNAMMGNAPVEDAGVVKEESPVKGGPDYVESKVDSAQDEARHQIVEGGEGQSPTNMNPAAISQGDDLQPTPPVWFTDSSRLSSSSNNDSATLPMGDTNMSDMLNPWLATMSNPVRQDVMNMPDAESPKLANMTNPVQLKQLNMSGLPNPDLMNVSHAVSMGPLKTPSPMSPSGMNAESPKLVSASDPVNPMEEKANRKEEFSDSMAFNFIISALACLGVFSCTLLVVYCVRRWQQKGSYAVVQHDSDETEMDTIQGDIPDASGAMPAKDAKALAPFFSTAQL